MEHTALPPLGEAGERGSVGLFWGTSTTGKGLKLYMEPHPDDIQAKAKKAMNAIDNALTPAPEMKAGIDLNAAEIDPATGKLKRAMLPTLKQILSATTVAKQDRAIDDDDPDMLIKGSSANDTISAALTAPTNPGDSYFNVLKALIAAVRKELIPLTKPTAVFKVPNPEDLGPAFPEAVQSEDPEFFERRDKQRMEIAFQKGSVMTAMRRAHVAIGDELVYCFDRRPIAPDVRRGKRSGSQPAGGSQGKGKASGNKSGTAAGSGAAGVMAMSGAAGSRRGSAARGPLDGGPSQMSSTTHGSTITHGSTMTRGTKKLLENGLDMELDSSAYRYASAQEIVGEQGRVGLAAVRSGAVTVKMATGDAAAGTVAGIRVGADGPGKEPPIGGDLTTDALRWTAQAAIAAEHKRVRCEHALDVLGRELATEAARQTRLRTAAAKFAASESRRADPAGDWESYLQGLDLSQDVLGGSVSKTNSSPSKRSLRFPGVGQVGHPLEGDKGVAKGRAGATSFKASDLAWVRFDVAQDRAEAADSIIRVLEEYRLVPVSVAAGYLRQTLDEVDKMYGELVGARAKEKGVALSQEDIQDHIDDMNARVEDGEDLRATEPPGFGNTGGGAGTARTGTGRTGRRGTNKRVVLPLSPKDTMVREGGAVPYGKIDDTQEVEQYGPSMARTRRVAAYKLVKAEQARINAELADFGPARDALGGAAETKGPQGVDDSDPTLIAGLSAYNVRPFNARNSARDAFLAAAAIDPELDTGYNDRRSAAASAFLRAAGLVPGDDEDDAAAAAAEADADGGGIELDGAKGGMPGAGSGDGGSADDADGAAGSAADGGEDGPDGKGGDGTSKAGSVKGGPPGTAGSGAGRSKSVGAAPGKARRRGSGKDGKDGGSPKQPDLREPAEIAAEKVFGKAAMDSKGFRDVAMQLTVWNPLGSRPSWQKQILKSYDLSMLRESTGLKFDQVKRTPKEPPDGRYSHLTGRYLKADDLRKQLAAARTAQFGNKIGHNTGSGL